MDYAALEAKLGYSFTNPTLLVQALTHPSASANSKTRIVYERLEFLGDAVLELAVSRALFDSLPSEPEGVLTHMRSRIVSRQHFYRMALDLELDRYIILGRGEERMGGRSRLSNLSNTFEAIFGAMVLDSDYETTRTIALRILETAIRNAAADLREINPKGELQSTLQELFPESPSYETLELNQTDGDPLRFTSTVIWRNLHIGSGFGASKRKAEVEAATDALEKRIWLQQPTRQEEPDV